MKPPLYSLITELDGNEIKIVYHLHEDVPRCSGRLCPQYRQWDENGNRPPWDKCVAEPNALSHHPYEAAGYHAAVPFGAGGGHGGVCVPAVRTIIRMALFCKSQWTPPTVQPIDFTEAFDQLSECFTKEG